MIGFLGTIGIVLVLQVPPPLTTRSPGTGFAARRQEIRTEETTKLKALAARLSRENQPAAAKEVLAAAEPEAADGPTRFVVLPKVVASSVPGLATVPARPSGTEPWRAELRTAREAAARSLFALAEQAMSSDLKHYALADDCLRGVIARQPDDAEARRLLGYVPYKGGWATPFVVQMKAKGMVDHSTFGWVPATWVPHLEKGELPAPQTRGQRSARWLPAAEADALRAPWEKAWRIETEHFQIQSNVPLSEAIVFGRQLEMFHDLFCSLLADVLSFDGRLPLAQRFRDKKQTGDRATTPHQVYYFKDKQEYVDFLAPIQPGIDQSLGIYIPPGSGKGKRAPAYFFRDPGGQLAATATLFHEVSHQLLFESAGPNAYEKNVGNYWVFEGLGTYFETVEIAADGQVLVGGMVGPRIAEARRRLLMEREYVPIEQLVRLSKGEFNNDAAIHLYYVESMALAVFLMQAQGRAYREPFLDYVKDAYRGRLRRDTGKSLEDRLGVPYSTLDTQFITYLRGG